MDRTLKHVEVSSAVQSDLVARLPALLTPEPSGLAPHGVAEEGWRALRQNLSARERFRLRLDVQGADGEMLYVAVGGKPVFDLDGNFCGYRGTGRDVTHEVAAREAARRAERRLIEAMDAAPCAVALVDSQLHLVSGNSALRTMASAKGERLPFGGPFCGFLASLKADDISPEILRGLAETGEMREIAIGGRWYLVAARGLSGGGMVLTFSDVTVPEGARARACRGQTGGRIGQPPQIAIPGHHEPRTAHAAQRHSRLFRSDPGRRLRPHPGLLGEICGICRFDPRQRPASALRSSRRFSTIPRSRREATSSTSARSICATWLRARSPSCRRPLPRTREWSSARSCPAHRSGLPPTNAPCARSPSISWPMR